MAAFFKTLIGHYLVPGTAAILLAATAQADQPATYPTVDAAAVQALRAVIAIRDCHEHAGVIVKRADGYAYTAPVTGGEFDFGFTIRLQPGETLAGIYHTHPDCGSVGEFTRMFSPQDVAQAKALRVPSYIGVQVDGAIRKFDPQTDHTQPYVASAPFGPKVARGTTVGDKS